VKKEQLHLEAVLPQSWKVPDGVFEA
jgi:hypothetical protein